MTKKYNMHKDSHRTIKGVKQKRCTKCRSWKEESEFNKDRARKDGLTIYCKRCVEAYGRKRRSKNGRAVREYLSFEDRHRVRRTIREKLCSRCKQWKYESEFCRERRLKDGLSLWCKGCSYKPINKSHKPKKKSVRKNLRYEERHRTVNGVKEKFCRKCKSWKNESEFYKNRRAKDGLDGRCKKCSYKPTGKSRKKRLAIKN